MHGSIDAGPDLVRHELHGAPGERWISPVVARIEQSAERADLVAECAVGVVRRPVDALQTPTFGVGAEHGVLQPGACAQGQERGERTQSRKRPRATCHRYRFAASAS